MLYFYSPPPLDVSTASSPFGGWWAPSISSRPRSFPLHVVRLGVGWSLNRSIDFCRMLSAVGVVPTADHVQWSACSITPLGHNEPNSLPDRQRVCRAAPLQSRAQVGSSRNGTCLRVSPGNGVLVDVQSLPTPWSTRHILRNKRQYKVVGLPSRLRPSPRHARTVELDRCQSIRPDRKRQTNNAQGWESI